MISLAPGDTRLPTARNLYLEGIADALAVSWFPSHVGQDVSAPDWGWQENESCRNGVDGNIHCFTPTIDSTYGEALSVKNLVEEQGWRSITVVTSRYHVFRTKFIFERSMPAGVDVEVIAPPTELSRLDWLRHIIYENTAFVKAIFETSGWWPAFALEQGAPGVLPKDVGNARRA